MHIRKASNGRKTVYTFKSKRNFVNTLVSISAYSLYL